MTHNIAPALHDRATPITDLHPHPKNARRRDPRAKAELQASLTTNGQYRTVIARRVGRGRSSRLELLAGHGTVEAARELGWDQVAVDVHEGVSDEAAARIVLADNRTSDLAGYDDGLLAELLSSMPDLTGTGYDADDLAALLAAVDGAGGGVALTDPDEAPDVPDTAAVRARVGDVYLLGPHRLVCGDSTDPETYRQLLGEELVDLVWTDPPYGVAYVGKTADALTIENDTLDLAGLEEFLRASLGAALGACRAGAPWYVTAPHGPMGHAFGQVLLELGVWKHSLVWVKHTFAMGRSDYHYRHEAMFYGWHPGGPRLVPLTDRTQDSVWEFDKPSRNAQHPTMKPVALIVRAVENSSRPGAVVLDPFGGSGSTLIACHTTGRVARLIELDPRYCDVICRRYQEHTGVVPVLERTGAQVSFVEAEAA